MPTTEKCCGNCKHHERDRKIDEYPQQWMCCNPDSDMNALWTDYGDTCADWEERE